MKIKALAPWFGGKRTLAPEIVREMGPHRTYWEPFCGSMAVLMAKPSSSFETVNDLHGDLINLAKVIRDPVKGPMLYRRLRRVLMAKPLHAEAAAAVRRPIDASSDPLDRAEAYFIASWMGRNGVAGSRGYNFGYCIRYTSNGGHAAERFANAVASIPAWRRRLREVNILQENAFDLIPRIADERGCVIYVDSPYIEKGALYVHDFKAEDHDRQAELLARFRKARVIVSYYDHPRLAELYPYPQWTIRRIEVSKAMAHQGKRGENDTRAVECLILNGPSRVEHASPLFAGATP